MKRLLVLAFIFSILFTTSCDALSGLTGSSLKIGLVTDVGGLNDKSFNALANTGRLDAAKDFGVQTSVIESKKQEDYVPNLTTFAQQNYDLVIGVGFLMTNSVWKVAKQFPNVKFAIIDGAPADDAGKTENLPNVANLFFKEQEAGYLVGVIAATMAKDKVGKATHNTVCSMGGIPIPPVDHYIAGYEAGAKAADPSIKTLHGYSQDFVAQDKCKEIALNQIAKGSKVVFQVAGQCGLGALDAAKGKGAQGIGVDADQGYLGSHVMTSALKKVDVAVLSAIKAASAGKLKGGKNVVFDAKVNGVGYGKWSAKTPASIKAAVAAQFKLLKAGKIKGIPAAVK